MNSVNKKDIIWSYLAQFLNFGSGLILLPIILRRLSSSELAIWYIFLSANALANLLDFGFHPTIMRNTSYVFSGANILAAKGIVEQELLNKINPSLLFSLIKTCKNIYKIISLSIFFIFSTFGTYYLYVISKEQISFSYILTAWLLYTLSVVMNFYFHYCMPLLLGKGKIKETQIATIFSNMTYLVISYILILNGKGLIGIAIANLLGSIVNRVTLYYFFYDKEVTSLLNNVKKEAKPINLFRVLWYNSYRMGLVSIGAFLILKMNTFLATYFLGLKIAASYGLTLQLSDVLMRISIVFFSIHIPQMNGLRIAKKTKELIDTISKCYVIAWLIYIIGFLFILFLGEQIIKLISSNTPLLTNLPLFLLFIIIFLEMNHSISATVIVTKNEVPFVKAALVSGIAIGILSYFLLKYTSLGIYAILISQGIVQLAYNNWKWPKEVLTEFKISNYYIIKNGLSLLLKNFKGSYNAS